MYCFYIPYHLPHLETPLSIARLVDFADLACTPKDGPVVDVISIAKRDLKPGDKLDGIGGFTCYGVTEKYSVSMAEGLLPIGLATDCELINAVPKDQAIRMTDISGLPDSVAAKLRTEQDALYPG